MTRKSRREIEQAIDRLRADRHDGAVAVVMERVEAEQAGFPIRGEADGSGGLYRNRFRAPPDPTDGEDLVVAHVPLDDVTTTFADREVDA